MGHAHSFISYPRLQVATTYAAHREVLIGCTAGEGRFLVSLLEQTVLQGDTGNTTALSLRLKETVRQFFESLNFSRHQQRVLEKVQASIDRSEMPSQSAWRDFVGSVFVGCPVQYFIESLAQSTTTSVYVFEFAHRKLGRHVQVQGYRQAFGTSAGGYPAAPRVVTCYKRSSTRKK
ncbi:uncharacterized protein LOC119160865 isoform X2 [Rhipicephalus microplus]|uniref:uncharacterized protein LOC119160865 isoform X2 n=1 Tax=Rhipicephalus microplus TaxID=6941 RepID=UPI003F6B1290